jgi:uncharacterized membrane protein YfcA
MTANTIFMLIAIGMVAGILGGMIGLGGGVIMIPAMMIFLAMDQKTAQGTSVAVMLPPIGLLAAYNYYKAGYVNVPYAIIIAVAFMAGGYFGSKAALLLPEVAMRRVFAVLLVIIAAKMFFGKS